MILASCGFDFGDTCFYEQGTKDDTDWVIQQKPTDSKKTGPITDHSGYGG